jgi:hypothetical protein
MWDTPKGIRKLKGRERALFRAALLSLFDELRGATPEDEPEFGVPAFDTIDLEERPWILLLAAEALLGDGEAPEIRAWNEGSLAAVYEWVRGALIAEIELRETPGRAPRSRTRWRGFVHIAWMEVVYPEIGAPSPRGEGEKQSVGSRDLDEWLYKLELLREEVLHDDDSSMDGLMDIPPEKANQLKEQLGIPEDYYTAIPPVLTDADRRRLEALYQALIEEEGTESK